MANAKTRSTERTRFKKKLRSWGMHEAEIRLCVSQVRERQMLKLNGKLPIDAPLCTRAEYIRLLKKNLPAGDYDRAHFKIGDDYVASDDKGYKPPKQDALLHGVGRAVGAAAKVVKRGKTITKFEYDKET